MLHLSLLRYELAGLRYISSPPLSSLFFSRIKIIFGLIFGVYIDGSCLQSTSDRITRFPVVSSIGDTNIVHFLSPVELTTGSWTGDRE